MKNKKAFIFSTMILIYMIVAVVLLGLLVWFGFRISEGISAIIGFLKSYGIWVLIGLALIVFHKQLRAILNFILNKFGVKV